MRTFNQVCEKIDFDLLDKQRKALCYLLNSVNTTKEHKELIDGALTLLDEIADINYFKNNS